MTDERTPCRRQSDLMAHLAEQYRHYNEQILPLYPDGVGDCDYSETKNEFLESLWDVISTHFDDLQGQDNDGETQEKTMFENNS